MTEENSLAGGEQPQPPWQPLSRIDRRVAGVLIEKAKTTPSAYPMTLNAITTGCNQKSNRHPAMELTTEQVEESLERLRGLGAVGMIEGYGRVDKFRHYMYEWLGVDKVELSVMAELLLRGPQTVGELRGRASRMDPIPDQAALQPILHQLKEKGLVLPLTAEGRGHAVTHALYPPEEMEKVRAQFRSVSGSAVDAAAEPFAAGGRVGPEDELVQLVEALRQELAELRTEIDNLSAAHQKTEEELRRLREDLGA